MERLTYRLTDQCDHPTDSIILKPYLRYEEPETRKKILNRLAAYEDTGLEPDAVNAIKHSLMGKSIAEIKEFEGIPIQRLRELAQAEQDGRLVVLDEPMRPLVWGDNEHDTILCPRCLCDLMGGFEFAPSCETMIFQCPHCGQPIASDKAITMEQSDADAALAGKEGSNE